MQQELTIERLSENHGSTVYDSAGEKIGKVEDIYYDDDTRQPEWLGIGTGLFGTKRVLVPLQGAHTTEDGLMVAYAKGQVKDSPDVDGDEISQAQEDDLYAYYGIDRANGGSYTGSTGTTDYDTRGDVDVDRTDDRTVTRSEEELAVGKREREIGRARLHKWVETVPVDTDVQLREERVRVERQPIDEPVSGAQIGEETIET